MNTFNPFPTAPAVVSPAQQAANQVFASGRQLANLMVNTYVNSYRAVWNNPNATPQQVIAAMGTGAAAVFAHSAAIAAFLVSQGAPGIPTTAPTGWTVVSNSDGTVTATQAS